MLDHGGRGWFERGVSNYASVTLCLCCTMPLLHRASVALCLCCTVPLLHRASVAPCLCCTIAYSMFISSIRLDSFDVGDVREKSGIIVIAGEKSVVFNVCIVAVLTFITYGTSFRQSHFSFFLSFFFTLYFSDSIKVSIIRGNTWHHTARNKERV